MKPSGGKVPDARESIKWIYGVISMFADLTRFADFAILLLRFMVAIVFLASGWKHVSQPAQRSSEIGMSIPLTIFLGAAEIAGGLGIAAGVLTQIAAIGLIVIMLGAIGKKIFVWHTGFWGNKAYGWHYDLMFVVMCLVIVFTNGGRFVLKK
jgi:putative oxidoreductase